jgi:6-pyruvoyltetrahydropterin/6-carboxytetrahydropterin synthase
MYRVTREVLFCFGHRLMNYDGKCRNLHGHNARAVLTFAAATLDHMGMVLDSVDIKRSMGTWIDATLDHKMILHEIDPLVPLLRAAGDPVFTIPANPTTENLAKLLFDRAAELGLPIVEVTLWETEHFSATYTNPA